MALIKGQASIENIITYLWAILVIGIVLGIFYQLGIVSSPQTITGSGCLANVGYYCGTPILNTTGSLAVQFSQIGRIITMTGVACSSNSTPPTSFSPLSLQVVSGQKVALAFGCPISSNAIGTSFTGYLWIRYDSIGQTGSLERIGVITTKVSTAGSSIDAVTNPGSTTTSTTTLPPTTIPPTTTTIITQTTSIFGSTTTISTTTTTTTIGPSSTTTVPILAPSNASVFVVGGLVSSSQEYNLSAYATFTANTINWLQSNSYPMSVSYPACASYSSYIYCVGGSAPGLPNGASSQTYYAPI